MADGKGCKCMAYSESECACDVDWTPQELIDARAEIARLREAIRRLADQDATLSVCDGSVTITMDATLTDAERDFLQNLRGAYEKLANQTGYVNAVSQKEARKHAALLNGLLEKHK